MDWGQGRGGGFQVPGSRPRRRHLGDMEAHGQPPALSRWPRPSSPAVSLGTLREGGSFHREPPRGDSLPLTLRARSRGVPTAPPRLPAPPGFSVSISAGRESAGPAPALGKSGSALPSGAANHMGPTEADASSVSSPHSPVWGRAEPSDRPGSAALMTFQPAAGCPGRDLGLHTQETPCHPLRLTPGPAVATGAGGTCLLSRGCGTD